MRKDPDADSQFVKVINAWIHFLSLQCADVCSLQPALEAQFLGTNETRSVRRANSTPGKRAMIFF